jgi:hypothetical protein
VLAERTQDAITSLPVNLNLRALPPGCRILLANLFDVEMRQRPDLVVFEQVLVFRGDRLRVGLELLEGKRPLRCGPG